MLGTREEASAGCIHLDQREPFLLDLQCLQLPQLEETLLGLLPRMSTT